jgi:hypothetical protein
LERRFLAGASWNGREVLDLKAIVARLSAVVALVLVVAFALVGGSYDYSALIDGGTLLSDVFLMVSAALVIAVGLKLAFIGARVFGKAVHLIKP